MKIGVNGRMNMLGYEGIGLIDSRRSLNGMNSSTPLTAFEIVLIGGKRRNGDRIGRRIANEHGWMEKEQLGMASKVGQMFGDP